MHLVEIFSSIQGEGPHVGRSSLFIRFGGCDLRCTWCDSPETWTKAATCRIETMPGSERFEEVANPVTLDRVDAAIEAHAPAPGSFVSLTGGEPLLQPDAVRAVAERVRTRGLRVYLETHGLARGALHHALEHPPRRGEPRDLISMDWKLASDVFVAEQGPRVRRDFHAEHEAFLREAAALGEVYVKIVVTPNTREDELERACVGVHACAPEAELVLQPVTPSGAVRARVPGPTLLRWHRLCEQLHPGVRLIPQTHKIYGVL